MHRYLSIILAIVCLISIQNSKVKSQDINLEDIKENYSKLYTQKNYKDALPLAIEYAEGVKAKFGNSDIKYAKALNNVGLFNYLLKDYSKAERAFKKALSIAEQIDPDHPDVEFALNQLVNVYEKLNKPKIVAFLKKRASAIKERNDLTTKRGPASDDNDYTTVPVFFATDRKNTRATNPKKRYGSKQSELINGSYLDLGIAMVSIPGGDRHVIGQLEEPSIMRFEWNEDPAKHVVLLEVKEHSKEHYFELMKARIASSAAKKAFIFVHGYNVSFEDAARRTAQMAYDLNFKGAPIFYSWPSKGATWGYTSDEVDIQWTEPHLKQFLTDFFKKSNAENVYIIAHSMGNRALTKVISDVAKETPKAKTKIKEIILAAPDIDASVFTGNIVPEITKNYKNITLYASSGDNALLGSEIFHGNRPRAGDAGDGLVVVPGIETIDVSGIDSSLLGHSYIAGTRSILEDVAEVFAKGKRAKDRRNMLQQQKNGLKYWVLEK